MNINNPEELKKYFEEFKELVKNEEADKAMHMLEELLKSIERKTSRFYRCKRKYKHQRTTG